MYTDKLEWFRSHTCNSGLICGAHTGDISYAQQRYADFNANNTPIPPTVASPHSYILYCYKIHEYTYMHQNICTPLRNNMDNTTAEHTHAAENQRIKRNLFLLTTTIIMYSTGGISQLSTNSSYYTTFILAWQFDNITSLVF